MVTRSAQGPVRLLGQVIVVYAVVAISTVALLGILSATSPHLAPTDAWVHAIIVGVFAVVLPLRLRGVRSGKRGSLRAIGIISGVLVAVNVAEASIPGFVPTWMRVEMVAIALLLAISVVLVIRIATVGDNGAHGPITAERSRR
ncbi:hypothetical protein QNM97_24570 [Gordonia sp. L191]|uniref:hypothetical protein n=1 Tax=unclassified Gordonia (in: high G+C Gram-positive bacteria) TaxID=2657482 RepID=UPI001557D2A1|nr:MULTISPECIES: hypothetical protein [unclassified Gordonia (in: high G+C Gram-positive bacteria)]WHU47088.1 hypothetical protein QNM97_24570 [Gordonia sp. L191]